MRYLFSELLPLWLLIVYECGRGRGQGPSNWLDGSILGESACTRTIVHLNVSSISCNFSTNDFVFDANTLPLRLFDLEILQGGNILFEAGSFSKLPFLGRIVVRSATSLTLKTSSFLNLSQSMLRLEIDLVGRVEVENKAFHLPRAPVTMNISQCQEVIIHDDSIPWILELTLSDITNLLLMENAFSLSSNKITDLHQGRRSKITLSRVFVEELPENSFPRAAEITILASSIRKLRKNCIFSLEVDNVTIEDSILDVIESEAFSVRSLLKILSFKNVSVSQLQTRAIVSAVTNFNITNSKISSVDEKAFSMSTMVSVSFVNNVFVDVKASGIMLNSWNNLVFENNTLRQLAKEAINVQYDEQYAAAQLDFRFVGNILEKLEDRSLNFNVTARTTFAVGDNIFIHRCQCQLRPLFNTYVDSSYELIEAMYNDSYCAVSSRISKCFKRPQGFMRTHHYVQSVCDAADRNVCLGQAEEETNATTTATTTTPENPNIVKAVGILNEHQLNRERVVLNLVLAVAMAGVVAALLLTVCLWFGRRARAPPSECHVSSVRQSFFSYLSRLLAPTSIAHATSTASITLVSVHDYAEVLPHKFIVDDDDDDDDVYVYVCTDKATQTLPEELTQELLQALREKLDDPENYREARCMIEHLYDLIKVEEYCNNNVLSDDVVGDLWMNDHLGDAEGAAYATENLYDTIRPDVRRERVRRLDRTAKTPMAHKGTRAPSPDKLSPQTYTNPSSHTSSMKSRRAAAAMTLPKPLLTEYMEPTDRRSFVYSELPYDRVVDSATLNGGSGGGSHEYTTTCTNTTTVTATATATSTISTRPYSGRGAIVTDYTDPRDVNLPIYSELDDMIRRPLPLTPTADQVNNDLGNTSGTRL